jgi:hypothetical protein
MGDTHHRGRMAAGAIAVCTPRTRFQSIQMESATIAAFGRGCHRSLHLNKAFPVWEAK